MGSQSGQIPHPLDSEELQAWHLSHLFILVIGGMAIKAKGWQGWKVATVFGVPMRLLILLVGAALSQRETFLWGFPILTTAGFIMLGSVVRIGAGISK